MSAAALLIAALLGGQTPQEPPPPGARYMASGSEPFWTLVIYDDRTTLSGVADEELVFPRARQSVLRGVRHWQARGGARAVRIEARRARCETEAAEIYADTVRVHFEDRVLTGCGGRLIRGIEE